MTAASSFRTHNENVSVCGAFDAQIAVELAEFEELLLVHVQRRARVDLDWFKNVCHALMMPNRRRACKSTALVQAARRFWTGTPRNSKRRAITSSMRLFGHEAPAVTPTVIFPDGSQSRVSTSACLCWS